MTTTFTPMRAAYFPEFCAKACESYAFENVQSGRWPAEGALALAQAETERLLPQGLATPDHHFLEIQAAADGRTVGFVWFAKMQRGPSMAAFIYQIHVDAEARRQGHALAALRAVEAFARTERLSAVALHVFQHNAAALALYRAAGYAVASLNLHKLL